MIRSIFILLLVGLTYTPSGLYPKVDRPTEAVDPSKELYVSLQSSPYELPNKEVFSLAYNGLLKLQNDLESKLITIIDFSLPSTMKRLWVIDTQAAEILEHTFVMHGRNSGGLIPTKFSNRPESYQSSLGFFKTAETYWGRNGYSLKLDGLEKNINDQARNRAIVIHGSRYAKEDFVERAGVLGRSLGCPAIPSDISRSLINNIKEGSLVFAFGNSQEYFSQSQILCS